MSFQLGLHFNRILIKFQDTKMSPESLRQLLPVCEFRAQTILHSDMLSKEPLGCSVSRLPGILERKQICREMPVLSFRLSHFSIHSRMNASFSVCLAL